MTGAAGHLRRLVAHLLGTLVEEGRLELVDGAALPPLVEEVLLAIGRAGQFSQAGSTIAAALVGSELVEEVYADDEEILQVFNHMYG